ncbi:MAG: hypothetical protein HQM12_20735 [SAR324 cluster bacterium]|nr:hypothetical protein [SAR324 cluster bacterium]MBF0353358.1 hypothetical protein [SAR324 cluster bacterium]
MSEMKIEFSENGICFVSGKLNEYMNMAPVVHSGKNPLILNLKGVVSTNSIGVKMWIDGLQELREKQISIEYHECSLPILLQCNMIPSFSKNIAIQSFFIDYACADCGEEKTQLLTLEQVQQNDYPIPSCPECGEEMEMDKEDILDFLEWTS